MRTASCVFFLHLLLYSVLNGATVCDILAERLQKTGMEVEVTGHIRGTAYEGFRIYDARSFSSCVDRWIFSWPAAILLRVEEPAWSKLKDALERQPDHTLNGVVRGRLLTSPDLFIVTLPWRRSRPLGWHLLGTAAMVAVSEMKLDPQPRLPVAR